MKKHHRLLTFVSAFMLILASFPCTALAADFEGTEMIQAVPAPSSVYPAEVRESEENGIHRIEKVYYLTRRDDPSAIPTDNFEREGRTYVLLDVLKNDQSETDTKDHIEVVTVNSSTDNMSSIIQQLEPALEVTTEDGYTGTLAPDYPGIKVAADGYKTSSRTVTAKRNYPNLSDADASLIPKTIQDGGRTLTLADVQWQENGGYYSASATYSGTATGKYATGYTVTVEYKGEVTRTRTDSVIYTAVFASQGETHFDRGQTEGDDPQDMAGDATQDGGENVAGKIVILIIAGAFAIAIISYGGWRAYKFIRDKKRGYV